MREGRRPKRAKRSRSSGADRNLERLEKRLNKLQMKPVGPRRTALEKLGIELAELVVEQEQYSQKVGDLEKRILGLATKIKPGGGNNGGNRGSGSGSGPSRRPSSRRPVGLAR
jgi:hypothetical protein